jgi:hypothetical protein
MPAYHFPLTPRRAFEYDAPRPELRLVLTTDRGRVPVPFVVDTGAAITLIPLAFAELVRLSGERRLAGDHDRPRTMTGRLDGLRGTVTATLGEVTFNIPCFFYRPKPRPPAGAPPLGGPPGRRTAPVPPAGVAESVGTPAGRGNSGPPPRCVLGRLGFLNRVDLLVGRTEFYVTTGTDRITPPPPFRRGG